MRAAARRRGRPVNADALSNGSARSPFFRRAGYNDVTYIPPGGTAANAPRGGNMDPVTHKMH